MNEVNIKLLNGLSDYLKSQNKSPITIRGYTSDLRQFFRYVEEYAGDKSFTDLSKQDFINFASYERARGCHGKRIQRMKASLQNLGDYIFCMLDDEYPNYHPLHTVIKVRDTQNIKPPVIYKDEDISNILAALTDAKEYRCILYIALGMYSGLRKSELLKIKKDWFVEENLAKETNNLYYRSPYPIHTKGSPDRKQFVYIKRDIEQYLSYFDYAKNVTDNTMSYDAEKIKNIADEQFHWHALRHYFVTDWLRKGMPPEILVKIIGWRDMDMIRVYNDMTREEQISKYFNGGNYGNN